jgi:hypothetical protein
MTNDCDLGAWQTNSRIEHAVSSTPTGPFDFHDIAIPTQAHNAAPIVLPDGTYALIHIFAGSGLPNGGHNCTNKSSATQLSLEKPVKTAHNIHVSTSLNGPWTPLVNNTLPTTNCDNPSPMVLKNGTIYVGCGRQIKGNYIHLWRRYRSC